MISLEQYITEVKDSIANGRLEVAFRNFRHNCLPLIKETVVSETIYLEYEKECNQLSAQYKIHLKEKHLQVSNDSSVTQNGNKIMNAFLSFINDVVENIDFKQKPIVNGNEVNEIHEIKKKEITITLDRDFKTFSLADQERFSNVIKELLKMDEGNIIIKKVDPGSVKITLNLGEQQVEKLEKLIKDGKLEEWDVTNLESQETDTENTQISEKTQLNIFRQASLDSGDDYFLHAITTFAQANIRNEGDATISDSLDENGILQIELYVSEDLSIPSIKTPTAVVHTISLGRLDYDEEEFGIQVTIYDQKKNAVSKKYVRNTIAKEISRPIL